jgi:dienelactone hydrolase
MVVRTLSLLTLLAVLACTVTDAQESVMSVEDIWGLEEMRELPLDVEVLSSESIDGVTVEEIYFTSEIVNDKPVRVYGFLAKPEEPDGKVPGWLALHGGGGTANKEQAVNNARALGVVVFNIDWSASKKRAQRVTNADALEKPELFGSTKFVEEDLSDFSARHTIRAISRCVDLLIAQEAVDPERIAVGGGSWGGFLSLLVGGLDDRIKCTMSGFGAGGFRNTYSLCSRSVILMDEKRREFWLNNVDPIRHVANTNGPVALMTATNEFHFWLNGAIETFGEMPEGSIIVISPNTIHRVGSGVIWPHAEWVKYQFLGSPEWPRIKDFSCNGKVARWTVNSPLEVAKGVLLVSPGRDNWPGRIWLEVEASVENNEYAATLPDWLAGAELDAYPLVIDKSMRGVSDVPVHVDGVGLVEMSAARPDPGLIDDFSGDQNLWRLAFANYEKATITHEQADNTVPAAMFVTESKGNETSIEVETNAIVLAAANLSEYGILTFKANAGGMAKTLTIELFENPGDRDERVLSASADLKAGEGWQEVAVALRGFEVEGEEPKWEKVSKLNIRWDSEPNAAMAFACVRIERTN